MRVQEAKELFGYSSLQSVSDDDIKAKYRELVKETHPDSGGSKDEFMRVKEAKDVLLRANGSASRSSSSTSTSTRSSSTTRSTSSDTNTKSSNSSSDSASSSDGFSNPYRDSSRKATSKTASRSQSTTSSQSQEETTNNTTQKSKTTQTTESEPNQSDNLSGKQYTVTDNSDSHFVNSVKNIRKGISSIIGKFNLVMFIALFFIGLSTHEFYLPFVTQYTTIPTPITSLFAEYTEVIKTIGYIMPVLIYFDLRYQQDNSRKLCKEFAPQTLMDTVGFKSPLTLSVSLKSFIRVSLIGLSFSGWIPYAIQQTQIGQPILFIVYSVVILVYVLVRPTIPTPAQFKAKFGEKLED